MKSIQYLTMEDVSKYSEDFFDDNEMNLCNYDNNQELEDDRFILCEVVLDSQEYIFIHGYLGDEPCGLIHKNIPIEELNEENTTSLHWSMENEKCEHEMRPCKCLNCKSFYTIEQLWYLNSLIYDENGMSFPDNWTP